MTLNPILKVLSTLKRHKVKCLLIGGQACIVYGAAEFSRDSDFVILASEGNLIHLRKALESLRAKLTYVPALEASFLRRGHACHFRCGLKGWEGLRIDIMARLRGCEPFENLWQRRKKVRLKDGSTIDVIGLSDLVQSKKTQRDKDWLMLRRLVENDIILHKASATDEKVRWWFLECRSAEVLVDLAKRYPEIAKGATSSRPLLLKAIASDIEKISLLLYQEESLERKKDIEYWDPLRKELEVLRHQLVSNK